MPYTNDERFNVKHISLKIPSEGETYLTKPLIPYYEISKVREFAFYISIFAFPCTFTVKKYLPCKPTYPVDPNGM